MFGRKLELVHYDDGSDAAKANSFTKRLIESDKVNILIGGTTTGATMAMAPLVERAKVPFISLAGAVVVIDPVKKWVFKTPHTDRMAAEKVFEDMKKRGISKVGLLSETSGFGASGRKETQAVAGKYGITLVADETYGPKDTDTTAQLTRIKNAPGVQAVFVFGLGQGPAIVTKNYGQLGMKAVPMYQSHGVASNEYLKLSGATAEGVRLPTPALLIANALPANDAQKSIVTSYDKDYRDALQGRAIDLRRLCAGRAEPVGRCDQARRLHRRREGARRAGSHQGLRRHHRRLQHVAERPYGTGPVRVPHGRSQGRRLATAEVKASMLAQFLQFLYSGMTVGSAYALAALGFTIIYNTSGVINFAQGEFIMLGGMLAASAVGRRHSAAARRSSWPC